MNAGPDAIAWLDSELPSLIIGEGSRLGYAGFLNKLAQRTDLTIISMAATGPTLDQRCAGRGSKQNDAWRKGAASRARGALEKVSGARVIELNTTGMSAAQVLRLARALLPESLSRLK
jgi:hypothetical protein